ncbi:hypothetical protein ACWPOB_17290 [Rhodococcus sp. 2H158]
MAAEAGRAITVGLLRGVTCHREAVRAAAKPLPRHTCGIVDQVSWKIERTLAWLTGYRRLTIRYERHGEHFAGFLQLAAALTCWKKLPK